VPIGCFAVEIGAILLRSSARRIATLVLALERRCKTTVAAAWALEWRGPSGSKDQQDRAVVAYRAHDGARDAPVIEDGVLEAIERTVSVVAPIVQCEPTALTSVQGKAAAA
jgi:hypothetical protein